MNEEIIQLTRERVVFRTDSAREIGSVMDLEVGLPEDVNLASFTIKGMITDCRQIRSNGNNTYMLEMRIGTLSKKNSLILDAYVEFLKREEVLEQIRRDNLELQDALSNLGEKLMQLIAVSEQLIKETKGKITIH